MARIAGVDLPKNKKVLYGLQYIFGVGENVSAVVLEKANVNPDKKISDLTDEEVAQIRAILTSEYKVEGALLSEVQQNIKRLGRYLQTTLIPPSVKPFSGFKDNDI